MGYGSKSPAFPGGRLRFSEAEVLFAEFGGRDAHDVLERAGEVVGIPESEFCGDLGDGHGGLQEIDGRLVDLQVDEVVDRGHRGLSDELPVEIRGTVSGESGYFVYGEFAVDVLVHEVGDAVDNPFDVAGLFVDGPEELHETERGDEVREGKVGIVEAVERERPAQDGIEVLEEFDALFDADVHRGRDGDRGLHVAGEDLALLAVEPDPVDAPGVVVFGPVCERGFPGQDDVLVGLDGDGLLPDPDEPASPDAVDKDIGIVAVRTFDQVVPGVCHVSQRVNVEIPAQRIVLDQIQELLRNDDSAFAGETGFDTHLVACF